MSEHELIIDDDDRYARLRLIAWWDQDKLRRASVLVVGAGALGNEVLKNLALLGIGTVYLVDFDRIEQSNLTRSTLFRRRDCGQLKATVAAVAMRDLNPDVCVVPMAVNVMTDVGLGLFRDVDVVIGCLDNREARLWVNRCCWKVGTPWIDGGIQEINGVVKVFVPPDSACYECGMTDNDYRLINRRYSCPLLRQEDLQAGKVPTSPTISSMIGGLQTQEALKLLHGLPVLAGKALVYNGVANTFYQTSFQRRDDCLSHESYPEPLPLPLHAGNHTVTQLFEAVRRAVPGVVAPLRLELDRDLVISIDCEPCGISRSLMRVTHKTGAQEVICSQCGQTAHPHITHWIDEDNPLTGQTLRAVGVPDYDIVRVHDATDLHVVLLSGDSVLSPVPTTATPCADGMDHTNE